jgi:hypothetical protein
VPISLVLKAFRKFKSFGAKRLRTYYVSIKLKDSVTNIMDICRSLS